MAYAFDTAVALWGTAFDAAVEEAGRDAKSAAESERRIMTTVRRWIPSERKYAPVKR